MTALRLLDALLADPSGAPLPAGTAGALAAADRDCLLAAVYRRAYRDRIESTLNCAECNNPFDLDFSLDGLAASLEAQGALASPAKLEEGIFRLASGARFRLPTGRDECEVAELPPAEARQALLERCALEGFAELDSLEEIMESVAPVLDLELDARCPECGRRQAVHFDIQSYLLGALMKERRRLMSEVHRLAMAYGWSRNDILSLARGERRAYVEMVEAEISLRQRAHA
jgi:hypothetical protein